jgi:hypothetical protein
MRNFALIVVLLLVAGCTSIQVVNAPPDLSKCLQLGWVKSNKVDIEIARGDIVNNTKALGGNVLYTLPLSTVENTKGAKHKGLAYKCIN